MFNKKKNGDHLKLGSTVCIMSCLFVYDKIYNNAGRLLTCLIMADVTGAKTQDKIPNK